MSNQPSVDIDSSVQLRLLVPHQTPRSLSAVLRYRSTDPFAVTVSFTGSGDAVEWVFARDLLLTALAEGHCGDGDVRVRLLIPPGCGPADALAMRITLASPDGHAEIEADVCDFRMFLDRALGVVPAGNEYRFVDVDAELALLLAE
ncbi:MAG: hypothetical protein CSA58_05495 [Micrococcales bacterium]|nr:MAG: hypothetical protein CSA58_05495 [Micrococcales bacterium]